MVQGNLVFQLPGTTKTSTRPSHTKDFKNGSGPCLHGTQDEVGTTKNISGRPGVSIM